MTINMTSIDILEKAYRAAEEFMQGKYTVWYDPDIWRMLDKYQDTKNNAKWWAMSLEEQGMVLYFICRSEQDVIEQALEKFSSQYKT